jgi:hypothetical protein
MPLVFSWGRSFYDKGIVHAAFWTLRPSAGGSTAVWYWRVGWGLAIFGRFPLTVGFGSGSRRIWAGGVSHQDRKRWSSARSPAPKPAGHGIRVGGYGGVQLAGPGRPIVDGDPCLGGDCGDVDVSGSKGWGEGFGLLGRHRLRRGGALRGGSGGCDGWRSSTQKTPPSRAAPASAAPTTSARRPRRRGTRSVV